MVDNNRWRGQEAIIYTGGGLRVTLLPELGGKIVSITDETGAEYIFQRSDRPYERPVYGTGFDEWDCSGWDECFPTVAKCVLADGPWAGVEAPCHGEVWCVPHEVRSDGDRLILAARGVRFPYTFERSFSTPGDGCLRIDYTVTNHCAFPLPYLYSAHPLFAVSPGTRIQVPDEVRQVRVDNTRYGRLGGLGDALPWPVAPLAAGGETDLSRLTGPEADAGDKVFTQPLRGAGWCGLIDPVRQVACGFRFDSADLPRIGIWQNQGALLGHFNLALEPCSGYPDRLDLAIARGEARWLPAGGAARWSLTYVATPGGEERLQELLQL